MSVAKYYRGEAYVLEASLEKLAPMYSSYSLLKLLFKYNIISCGLGRAYVTLHCGSPESAVVKRAASCTNI